MTTHKHKRHSSVTGVPYPQDLRGRGAGRKTCARRQTKRSREEKKHEILIWILPNRGTERYRERKGKTIGRGENHDRGREASVGGLQNKKQGGLKKGSERLTE